MSSLEIETILENLTNMLETRGDDISEFSEHTYLTYTTSAQLFKTQQLLFHTDRTAVMFIPKSTMTGNVKNSIYKAFKEAKDKKDPEEIMSIISQSEDPEHVERKHVKTAIFIFDEDPQSHNRKLITDADKLIQSVGGMLQYFTYQELMFDPTKHVYVPLHEKLTDADVKNVIDMYQLKSKSQLPVILRTDIIARWLGLKHGDVVRITRNNPSSGIYYFYRCCV